MSESAFERLVIDSLGELKAEIVAVGKVAEQGLTIATQTLQQAKETNGRVTALEGWQDAFEDETEVGAAYAAGRKSVRDGDKALIRKLGSLLSKWSPYAAGALLLGIGIRLGAWFIGGLW